MRAIGSARRGGYLSYVDVPHGVELNGQEVFFALVHCMAVRRRYAASCRS